MPYSYSVPSDSALDRLVARVAEWRRHREEREELEAMGCETANRILAECGLTLNDLGNLTNPKVAELLPEMMKVIGVPDSAATRASRRDLERSCGLCEEWRRCDAAISVGTAQETWREFCRNASVLDALASEAGGGANPKD